MSKHSKIDRSSPITGVIEKLEEDTKGKSSVKIKQVLDSFGSRSHGPLLCVLSLFAISPLGAIPTVPTILGVSLFLLAVQIAFGFKHPWVPHFLGQLDVSREKLISAFDRIRKPAKWFEKLLRPRLTFLTGDIANRIVGGICAVLALTMIPLELIPLAVYAPAAMICVFSVALIASDGALVLVGLLGTMGTIWLAISSFFAQG